MNKRRKKEIIMAVGILLVFVIVMALLSLIA